jgi:hypothetical protein
MSNRETNSNGEKDPSDVENDEHRKEYHDPVSVTVPSCSHVDPSDVHGLNHSVENTDDAPSPMLDSTVCSPFARLSCKLITLFPYSEATHLSHWGNTSITNASWQWTSLASCGDLCCG